MSHELANYGKKVDEEFKTIDLHNLRTHNTAIDGDRLQKALRLLFPSLAAGTKEVKLRAFTEEYVKYKRRYVKHLQFDPDLKNLSKYGL